MLKREASPRRRLYAWLRRKHFQMDKKSWESDVARRLTCSGPHGVCGCMRSMYDRDATTLFWRSAVGATNEETRTISELRLNPRSICNKKNSQFRCYSLRGVHRFHQSPRRSVCNCAALRIPSYMEEEKKSSFLVRVTPSVLRFLCETTEKMDRRICNNSVNSRLAMPYACV
jgi:hypothetical protein